MPKRKSTDDTLQISEISQGEPQLPTDQRFSLVIIEGKNAGEEFRIGKWTVIVGRDASVSDFVLDDPGASRSHACLEFGPNGFTIEDLESTNGITLNQKPVTRGALKHGDKIGIGKTTLQFLIEKVADGAATYEIDL